MASDVHRKDPWRSQPGEIKGHQVPSMSVAFLIAACLAVFVTITRCFWMPLTLCSPHANVALCVPIALFTYACGHRVPALLH